MVGNHCIAPGGSEWVLVGQGLPTVAKKLLTNNPQLDMDLVELLPTSSTHDMLTTCPLLPLHQTASLRFRAVK